MRYCGIDLHSDDSVVVVTDETDKVLIRKHCPNDLQKILALLPPHWDEPSGIVVESAYNGYWLIDGLTVAGFNVKLTNTVAMKHYDGLKHSGVVAALTAYESGVPLAGAATTKPMPPTWRIC